MTGQVNLFWSKSEMERFGGLLFTAALSLQFFISLVTASHQKNAALDRISMLARISKGQKELATQLSGRSTFSKLIDNNAAAEQQEQGEGFTIPFYPGNSTVYDPLKSSTFAVVPHAVSLCHF